MATYACSDIHGALPRYKKALKMLGPSDVLYVIGDVIDRGPGGLSILRDMMGRDNVRLILGNHEMMMLDTLQEREAVRASNGSCPITWGEHEDIWTLPGNGGMRTLQEFTRLPGKEREAIMEYLEGAYVQKVLRFGKAKLCLVHSRPWEAKDGSIRDVRYDRKKMGISGEQHEKLFGCVWDSPFRCDTFVRISKYAAHKGCIFVTGHVPYMRLGCHAPARMGNLIDIDGGCAMASSEPFSQLAVADLEKLAGGEEGAFTLLGKKMPEKKKRQLVHDMAFYIDSFLYWNRVSAEEFAAANGLAGYGLGGPS